MTTLALNDIKSSQALDRKALAEIKGRGAWYQLSTSVSTGAWSGYSAMFYNYVGTTFHDGYLSRQYYGGYTRQRTQTEYSYWNHFVRV